MKISLIPAASSHRHIYYKPVLLPYLLPRHKCKGSSEDKNVPNILLSTDPQEMFWGFLREFASLPRNTYPYSNPLSTGLCD